MPQVVALDRLKSQLLTSGLQQRDNPLYQVINQLIDYLRQTIDATGLQLDDLAQCCENSKKPETAISNAPFPLPFYAEMIDESTVIPLPGPQGPQGVPGPAGSGAPMPYFWNEEAEVQEVPPLYTLFNAGSIPESAIIDGTILARVAANETITGNWTFTGNPTVFSTAAPTLRFVDSSGGADSKVWEWSVNAGVMYLTLLTDAIGGPVNAILIPRTGTNIDSFRIQTGAGTLRTIWDTNGVMDHRYGLMLSGQTSVSLTADQTAWNPSGLGTAFVILVTPTAAFNIRGILAQAGGTIITFINIGTGINTMTFQQEDAAASAANRILMTAANIVVPIRSSITLIYDATSSRWRVISFI